MTVVGVHPAVAYTGLRDRMLMGGRWMRPLLKLMMKTPFQAAQTTIYAALEPTVVNGNMYRSASLPFLILVSCCNRITLYTISQLSKNRGQEVYENLAAKGRIGTMHSTIEYIQVHIVCKY